MKKYLMTIRSGINHQYAEALELTTPDCNIYFYAENDEKAKEWRLNYLNELETIDTPFITDLVKITNIKYSTH